MTLIEFVRRMELKLFANKHKGNWHKCSDSYLLNRLEGETIELKDAIQKYKDGKVVWEHIASEAADVANFAMMIADNASRRKEDR